MSKLCILSWNSGNSSRLLAEGLGIPRFKIGTEIHGYGATILNWGVAKDHYDQRHTYINEPERVNTVANKRLFFTEYLRGGDYGEYDAFKTVPYFFRKAEAAQWLHEGEGDRTLVCRTKVRSSEGKGIVFATNPLDIPDAPLYTGFVPAKTEYRVHVVFGKVIDYVQKKRRRSFDGDPRIRNYTNNFVFCRNDIDEPSPDVLKQAIRAVRFFRLDFGAVDILSDGSVLEINTAPGLEGTTLEKYINVFKKELM